MAKPTKSDEPAESILERAVCLSLEIHKPGNRRKVQVSAIADPLKEFDRSQVGVSKQLLDADEYKNIVRYDNETRAWVYAHSVPCTFTGHGGVYMIGNDVLVKVYDTLTSREAHRQVVLVPAFGAVYHLKVTQAEKSLGPTLFDPNDYPPLEEVLAKFSMSWLVIEYGTPKALSSIRKEIFDKEKEKAAVAWKSAADDARDTLVTELSVLLTRMSERLSDPSKEFKDTLVTNMLDYFERFPFRNITGFTALEEQVEKVKLLIQGVKPNDLRKSIDIRGTVVKGVQAIQQQIEPMIVNRPRRKLVLEEQLCD